MTKVQPFSNMKEDARQLFEDKMQWWFMSCQWSGLYLGNAPGDVMHKSKKRKCLKRILRIISCLAVLYLLSYMTTNSTRVIPTSLHDYQLHSKTLFTSGWIQIFHMWLLSVMIDFGRGNLYSWCNEVSIYCDEYGLHEKCVAIVKKIPRNVIRNLIYNTIMTGVAVTIYELVPVMGQSIYLFPYEMRILNILASIFFGFLQNFSFSNLGPIVEICSNLVSHEMDRVNKSLDSCCEGKKVSKALLSTTNVNVKINVDVNDKVTDVSKRLDKAIEQHSRICDLIGHFNKCLYHYAAASFLVGLPMSCFALYILITKVKDTVDVVMTAMTMVTSLIPLMGICIMGCQVNYKAHQALDYIWKLPTANLHESTMRNLSQLTIRLTGTSIGYTVYGFFTFSMPAVLSIVGCILTYFIVVIQFKPVEEADCSSECNNTLPSWCVNNATV